EVLRKKEHAEQTYKSCQGILQLGKKHGHKRLIKACDRAHAIGYYNYKIIDAILRKNLDSYDEDPPSQSMPSHENIRGADYYQ
ncbi:MAG TPA: IS21 family transposase, partial [Acidobacteriota bacterium]